jgi:hypothetical protein
VRLHLARHYRWFANGDGHGAFRVQLRQRFRQHRHIRNEGGQHLLFVSGDGLRRRRQHRKTIKVYFRRVPLGFFAENDVELDDYSDVFSYNSVTTPNPNPADYPNASTGNAYVGSNKRVYAKPNTYIGGNVCLGVTSGGTNATYEPSQTTTLTGTSTPMCRVDPDPLGAVGGALAGSFTAYSASNDNAAYMTCSSGPCPASKIETVAGETVTLTGKTGGSNFYFTEIDIDNTATLSINTTNGPVNIYLTGKLSTNPFSAITVNGTPPSLTIYSRGSEDILIRSTGFKGTVYAPYAKVELKNNVSVSIFFGLIWSKQIYTDNGAKLFYDEALKNLLPLNGKIGIITSWKDVL